MEIRFKYEDLIARCEQLSSFESEGKEDAAGQSRYLEIHINEVDRQLIQQYIKQAFLIVEHRIDRMIEDSRDYYFDPTLGKEVKSFDKIIDMVRVGRNTSEKNDNIAFVRSITWDNKHYTYYGKFMCYEDGTQTLIRHSSSDPTGNKDYTDINIYYRNKSDGKVYRFNNEATDIEVVTNIHFYEWTIRTDSRWKHNAAFERHVSEAVVSYAMSAWLSDRLPERVAFYDALFTASTEMAVKNIFKKQAPRYEE